MLFNLWWKLFVVVVVAFMFGFRSSTYLNHQTGAIFFSFIFCCCLIAVKCIFSFNINGYKIWCHRFSHKNTMRKKLFVKLSFMQVPKAKYRRRFIQCWSLGIAKIIFELNIKRQWLRLKLAFTCLACQQRHTNKLPRQRQSILK